MRSYWLLISLLLTLNCKNRTKGTLVVGSGEDVEVTLRIEDTKNIERIEFSSGKNFVFIGKKDVLTNNIFIYKFKNRGRTFKTCVYTNIDTICTKSYVEPGYTPEIILIKDSLIITDAIISYN
ncbi:hypothetical protein [Tenacibaculum sp. 190524A02b]|uniref:hypothetical protein n=1 Tax=Tenacibaculum vairaonense TaxID=3137860 RepID=UPI0031FAE82B